MAAPVEAQVRLSLHDRLTAGLTRIQARMDRLTAPARRLGQRLTEIGRVFGIDRVGASIGRLASGLGNAARQATALAAGIGAIGTLAVGAGVRNLINVGADMEQYATTLEAVLGSSAHAESAMSWVSDFATRTPYELAEVTDAFVKLNAYGIDATKGSLEAAGNAAAILGKPIEQAVEAIADAMTGENERLKEFGIRAEAVGDRFKYSWMEDGKQMTAFAEKNSRAQIEATLTGIWNRQYAGGMDKLSRTWRGVVSNLSDAWNRFNLAINNAGFFDHIKDRAAALLDYVNRIAASGQLDAIAKRISDGLVSGLKALETALVNIDWDAAWQGIMTGAATVARLAEVFVSVSDVIGGPVNGALAILGAITFGPLVPSLLSLIPLVAKVGATLLLTPFGWVIGGLALVGASVYVLIKKWDEFVAYWGGLWGRIGKAFDKGFVQGIGSALLNFNPLVHVARGLDAVLEYFTGFSLLDAGSDLMASAVDGMSTKWAEITAWAEGPKERIRNWFSGIDLGEAGRAIIQSLWDGMKALWGDVTKWASDSAASLGRRLDPRNWSIFGGSDEADGGSTGGEATGGVTAPALPAPSLGGASYIDRILERTPAMAPPIGSGPAVAGASSSAARSMAEVGTVKADRIQIDSPIMAREAAPNVTNANTYNVTVNAKTDATAADIAAQIDRQFRDAERRSRDSSRSALND